MIEHAIVVPLFCVFDVKFCIFVAVREDDCTVLRVDVLESRSPDAQNLLIANCGPIAGLKEQD